MLKALGFVTAAAFVATFALAAMASPYPTSNAWQGSSVQATQQHKTAEQVACVTTNRMTSAPPVGPSPYGYSHYESVPGD